MLVNDPKKSECHLDFKRAIFRFESDLTGQWTILEVKRLDIEDQKWTFCLEYKKVIDYNSRTIISSGGGGRERGRNEKKRRAVFIHSIKFYDNEIELEGQNESLYIEDS